MPEGNPEAYSILDPIKEKGVVEGGLDLFTNLMPGVASGRAAQMRDTDGFQLSDIFNALGGMAEEVAYYTPGLGELLGADMAVETWDDDTDLLTKGLQRSGILGLPLGALGLTAATRRGTFTPHRAAAGVQGRPVTVGYANDRDMLARLSGTIDEPFQYDSIIPTISDTRRKLMKEIGNLDGIVNRQARTEQMRKALVGPRARNAEQVDKFLSSLGDALVTEVRDYSLSVNTMDFDKAAIASAATEASKFDWAIDSKVLKVGDDLPDVRKHWERLKGGENLSTGELGELTDAMVDFARRTQGATHPEMALSDPRFGIKSITLDGDASRLGLEILDFDGQPISEMPVDEVVKRINMMVQRNPAQLVPYIAENFIKFFETEVATPANWEKLKHSVTRWSPDGEPRPKEWAVHWYKIARLDGEKMAKSEGLPAERMVGVASVLSAGELWETNLQKAVVACKYLRDTPGYTAATFKRHMAAKGMKMTAPEAKNAIEVWESPQPNEWFYKKLTGKTALKQPNFTAAILKSKPKDIRKHSALNYALMSGQISDGDAARLFGEMDTLSPIVIDRHAFSLGLGFSMDGGGGSFSDNAYRSVRRGLEIAAASIGEIPELGRNMTSSELQAILWVAWREARGVTKDFVPQMGKLPPLWIQGKGPSYEFSRNILDFAQNPLPPGLHPLRNFRETRPAPQTPADLRGRHRFGKGGGTRRRSGRADKPLTIELSIGPEGTQLVDSGDQSKNRTFYRSSSWNKDGQVMRRRRPLLVEDAPAEMRRLFDSTYDSEGQHPGITGGRMMTAAHRNVALEDGLHIVLSCPPKLRNGLDGVKAHRRLVNMLEDRGVRLRWEIEPPHQGPTAVWKRPRRKGADPDEPDEAFWSRDEAIAAGLDPNDPATHGLDTEARHNLILDFDDANELNRAWGAINEFRVENQFNIAEASQGATDYVRMYGKVFDLKHPRGIAQTALQGAMADPKRGRAIATAYQRSKHDRSDEVKVRKAYDQFIRETEAQYDYITNVLGYEIVVQNKNPYDVPAEMLADLRGNRRLKVLSTESTGGHPYLTNEQNDKFRAVHDFFGHGGLGNTFDRNGEYVAYLKHAQMFSEQARGPMFSETMAQNSWLVFSAKNEAGQKKAKRLGLSYEGEFPAQKMTLLDRKFWSDHALTKERGYLGGEDQSRVLDYIYAEQILDLVAYTNGIGDAPSGSVAVLEHHIQDVAGNRLVHMSTQGDPNRRYTVEAHVAPDGLLEYFGESTTKRWQAGEGTHGFVENGGSIYWDGMAKVVFGSQKERERLGKGKKEETRAASRKGARHLFDVDVDGKKPERIALWIPLDERLLPQLSFNRGVAGGRPSRTVELLRPTGGQFEKGSRKMTVLMPNEGNGRIDGDLQDDVALFLTHTGWVGDLDFKAK